MVSSHPLSSLIIGNWKMNGDRKFAESFLNELANKEQISSLSNVNIVVCPPSTLTLYCKDILEKHNSTVKIGAQNCSHIANDGPYTGEVNARMYKDAGAAYIIIGHSERRKMFPHTAVKHKLVAAQEIFTTPILCVGETLEQRESGDTFNCLEEQLSVLDYSIITKPFIIAYEPVWAIGTGKVAAKEDIEAVNRWIIEFISKIADENDTKFSSLPLRILYGGSVNTDNAPVILSAPYVHGLLIGGASLNFGDFWHIVKTADKIVVDEI
jgi:triosephosphate isomerase (TIM)